MADKTPNCQAELILNPTTFCNKPRTVTLKLATPYTAPMAGYSPVLWEIDSCDDHVGRMEFQLGTAGHDPKRVKPKP
jgi:hypothetical protein